MTARVLHERGRSDTPTPFRLGNIKRPQTIHPLRRRSSSTHDHISRPQLLLTYQDTHAHTHLPNPGPPIPSRVLSRTILPSPTERALHVHAHTLSLSANEVLPSPAFLSHRWSFPSAEARSVPAVAEGPWSCLRDFGACCPSALANTALADTGKKHFETTSIPSRGCVQLG
jgi:hypothetical protein